MKTVVLCGGGTAGHVIPAVSLLPLLNRYFDKAVYIGEKGGIEENIARSYKLDFYGISCTKFRRNFSFKNALIPYRLIKSIAQAKAVLKKLKPSAVFSKGGYAALPVVIAAAMMKIPVIAHESDLSPGLSNKISARFCKAVCTSFSQCADKLKNGVYTGSPVRAELFYGNKNTYLEKFSTNKPVLLFMGGSSGAMFLNDILRKCLDTLTENFNIIHITGKGNFADIKNKGYLQIEFCSNIADVYAAADFVVSRAGSNSIFELLFLKKAALLIPLPKNASRGDQIENANYFLKKNCVLTAEQNRLTPNILIEKIQLLARQKNSLIFNIENNKFVHGNRAIVEQILKYSEKI